MKNYASPLFLLRLYGLWQNIMLSSIYYCKTIDIERSLIVEKLPTITDHSLITSAKKRGGGEGDPDFYDKRERQLGIRRGMRGRLETFKNWLT